MIKKVKVKLSNDNAHSVKYSHLGYVREFEANDLDADEIIEIFVYSILQFLQNKLCEKIEGNEYIMEINIFDEDADKIAEGIKEHIKHFETIYSKYFFKIIICPYNAKEEQTIYLPKVFTADSKYNTVSSRKEKEN